MRMRIIMIMIIIIIIIIMKESKGYEIFRKDKVEEFLKQSIEDGAFPGCVVIVGNSRGKLYENAFGSYTYGIPPPYDPSTVPAMTMDTKFDIASLSKVVGPTNAIARLYQEGRL